MRSPIICLIAIFLADIQVGLASGSRGPIHWEGPEEAAAGAEGGSPIHGGGGGGRGPNPLDEQPFILAAVAAWQAEGRGPVSPIIERLAPSLVDPKQWTAQDPDFDIDRLGSWLWKIRVDRAAIDQFREIRQWYIERMMDRMVKRYLSDTDDRMARATGTIEWTEYDPSFELMYRGYNLDASEDEGGWPRGTPIPLRVAETHFPDRVRAPLHQRRPHPTTYAIEISEAPRITLRRLRGTIAHELCHVEAAVVHGEDDASSSESSHGRAWRACADRLNKLDPRLRITATGYLDEDTVYLRDLKQVDSQWDNLPVPWKYKEHEDETWVPPPPKRFKTTTAGSN